MKKISELSVNYQHTVKKMFDFNPTDILLKILTNKSTEYLIIINFIINNKFILL